MDEEDLYEILGLEPGASRDQIERAHRFSLEMYGEDALAIYSLLEPAEVESQRARIREAFAVLGSLERRRAYDEGRGYAPPEPPAAPFAARPEPGGEELELPEVLTGPELKQIREARGMSLRQIANVTKIGVRFLEYIEEDRHALLPAPVYVRGFVQEYARTVGVDPKRAADAYIKRLAGGS